MLKTNQDLMGDQFSHGMRPYDYLIEFIADPTAAQFADPESQNWQARMTVLNTIRLGYGADEQYTCQFTMWDPDSVVSPGLSFINTSTFMAKPQNGEVVRVTVWDRWHPNGVIRFMGTIRSVHERKTENGVEWIAEAMSEVSRLRDPKITLTTNFLNDPIHPSPHFDPNGNMVLGQLKTVAQIIKLILEYKDAWNTSEFFTYSSIDWGSLETDVHCGAFVPSQMSFQNISKDQAILETLQRAGNYTFFFDPNTMKLRIVTLNLACSNCGPQWNISFVNTSNATVATGVNYAYDYHIEEDATEWSSRETYNVCRFTGAQIRFFSGTYPIPERFDESDPATQADNTTNPPTPAQPAIDWNVVNCKQQDNDTIAMQQERAYSLDRTFYRFTFPVDTTHDARKVKRYFVGMPLFPDWNIHEDYLPAVFEIVNVLPPAGATVTKVGNRQVVTIKGNPHTYQGDIELRSECIGDAAARNEHRMGHLTNLHQYQAWYATELCPACAGSGLVGAVYVGPDNEPVIDYKQIGQGDNIRVVPRVTNYIFDPAHFGAIDPATKQLYAPVGLVPYAGVNDYPLPWKNLCPYCRGVGLKPEYKIRNIQSLLVSARSNQTGQVQPPPEEVQVDPDVTATGPETWEQAQSRVVLNEGPYVQVETALSDLYLPLFQHRNKKFTTINNPANVPTNNAQGVNERVKKFAHPLQFTTLRKRWAGILNIPATDTRAMLAQPDWGCEVPYTTIMMGQTVPIQIDTTQGRVIFNDPVFISCRKHFNRFMIVNNNQVMLDKDGMLMTRATGRGYVTSGINKPTGYWRPARVWLMCHWFRENYYQNLDKTPAGTAIPAATVTSTTADGVVTSYTVRAAIVAGSYCIEAKKTNPVSNNTVGTEFETGNRTLTYSGSDDQAWLETTEADLYKLPVIPNVDLTPQTLETYKTTMSFDFPRARMLKYMNTSPGEVMLEAEGYDQTDYLASIVRPKVYAWRLRDDRVRLLNKCIRTLELTNKLQVNGTLRLVGIANDINDGATGSVGLGWVDYPDRGKVLVKRLSYQFKDGLVAELELSREEAHFGEIPLKWGDLQNDMMKDLGQMRRIFLANGFQANPGGVIQSQPGAADGTDGGPADLFDKG